ncbi:winged helix-turn-helix domain-containing protein, partial [Sphaerisporangium sp. NPDC049002]|uniref:winged helix-turn-helix domain-containing protein n=1 Tax=Sphaerisporangium sp. NPDC049002 TaxID=3155392 RepID=UPI0033D13561
MTSRERSPRREGESLQEALAAELRAAILSGQLQPGDPLPSEQRMADERGLARLTVARAYAVLRDVDGLITTLPRKGNFVRATPRMTWQMMRGSDVFDPWPVSLEQQELEGFETITVEMVSPAARVESYTLSAILDIGKGQVAARHHMRSLNDGTLVEATTAYYPERLVRDTPLTDPSAGDVDPYAVLTEASGQEMLAGPPSRPYGSRRRRHRRA